MTTIIWDGEYLTGDRKRTLDHGLINVTKVFKISEPVYTFIANSHIIPKTEILVGCCGDSSVCIGFVDQLKGIQKQPIPSSNSYGFLAILITKCHRVFEINASLMAIEITESNFGGKYAIGSGSAYAMGALYCGVSGKEAIKASSNFDSHTSCDCISVSFNK